MVLHRQEIGIGEIEEGRRKKKEERMKGLKGLISILSNH